MLISLYEKPQKHKTHSTCHMTHRRRMDRSSGILPIKLRSEKTMQSKSGGKNKEDREGEKDRERQRERDADIV